MSAASDTSTNSVIIQNWGSSGSLSSDVFIGVPNLLIEDSVVPGCRDLSGEFLIALALIDFK